MRLRAVGLAAAVIATFAGAAFALASGAVGRTLVVPGVVREIRADRDWLAIASTFEPPVGSTAEYCDRALAWRPGSGKLVRFSAPGQCRPNSADALADDRVASLALVGGRAIWTDYSLDSNGGEYCNALRTATLSDPRPLLVQNAPSCRSGSGPANGEFDAAGRGRLLVLASYDHCDGAGDDGCPSATSPAGDYKVALWRLVGARLIPIARLADGSALLDATEAQILVGTQAGSIELYDPAGRKLRTFPLPGTKPLAGLLSGSRLFVGVDGALEVFDAETGKHLQSFPLAPAAELAGVADNLAAYVEGRTLHLLRLSDGRDRVYATVSAAAGLRGSPPYLEAALTPAGLFYAYNLSQSPNSGRVVFVPTAELATVLR